ncbi:MAG: HAD-IIIA family hydrolase [Sediminibacterium sp.]|nr:HAD-IIIA family hydrolase [Sediminibacterium sp.]
MFSLNQVNKNWTLFLDRDGVINKELPHDYVKVWQEFIFYTTTLEALEILSKKFNLIIIITNQKGIGKQLYTIQDLHIIHEKMLAVIKSNNGHINDIFFAPDLDSDALNRKPQIGMALQAKQKYPSINFAKSIMVGNNLSDMEFGRNAGMNTIFLKTTQPNIDLPNPLIDLAFNHLLDFAHNLL